jgi:hypothetical protein
MNPTQSKFVIDMVHHNPGEERFHTKFLAPTVLQEMGYNGQCFFLYDAAHLAIDWNHFDPGIIPKRSKAKKFQLKTYQRIKTFYKMTKQANLQVFCHMDMLILPKRVVKKYGRSICNEVGEVDIERPKTQEILKFMFDEIFSEFPELDGLIIRTGETYLHDAPYFQGDNPILGGEKKYFISLLNLLREHICEKHSKYCIYRTWAVSYPYIKLQNEPDFYEEITNEIPLHPKLIFSIKHTSLDFLRRNDFNQCLGSGYHPQIVEVQCGREYEGKGAHPDYICKGVIEGFEEYAIQMKPSEKKGLQDIVNSPLFKGIWTWTRGGGWRGPYIKNEFWCELNASVAIQWILCPSLTEETIFFNFLKSKGITGENTQLIREICLKSVEGIIRGQYSVKDEFNQFWARDHFICGPGDKATGTMIKSAVKSGAYSRMLEEKNEAEKIWTEIEDLSNKLNLKDKELEKFIQISCTYGLIKYKILSRAFAIMIWAEISVQNNAQILKQLIQEYRTYWVEWVKLYKNNIEVCSTLYKEKGFLDNKRNGIGHFLKNLEKNLKNKN